MSILVMGLVWKHADVGKGSMLVLLAMADIAEDDGTDIYPRLDRLANKARLDVRQCRRCLRELEGLGLIEQVERASGRPGRFNSWRINLEKIVLSNPGGFEIPGASKAAQREGGQNVRPKLSTGHSRPRGRTNLTRPSDIFVPVIDNGPRPILEPSFPRSVGAAEAATAARVVWDKALSRISKQKATQHSLETAIPVSIRDGVLVLEFPYAFTCARVSAEMGEELTRAAGMGIKFDLTAAARARLPKRAAVTT